MAPTAYLIQKETGHNWAFKRPIKNIGHFKAFCKKLLTLIADNY
jgi:hypothetical protein